LLLDKLRERGEVRWTGKEWRTRCPVHDDNGPSLYVMYAPSTFTTVLRCGAGCKTESIVDALDHSLADLYQEDDELVEVDEGLELANQLPPRSRQAAESPPEMPSPDDGPDPAPWITEPADADLCDQVHGQLLAGLNLTEAHHQDLRRRGLSDDEIDRRGYRSLRRFDLH
jgi:hypothetical protein